jgi:hypothetical protein
LVRQRRLKGWDVRCSSPCLIGHLLRRLSGE